MMDLEMLIVANLVKKDEHPILIDDVFRACGGYSDTPPATIHFYVMFPSTWESVGGMEPITATVRAIDHDDYGRLSFRGHLTSPVRGYRRYIVWCSQDGTIQEVCFVIDS